MSINNPDLTGVVPPDPDRPGSNVKLVESKDVVYDNKKDTSISREVVATPLNGLIAQLSDAFPVFGIDNSCVDNSGRSPKINFTTNVAIDIESSESNNAIPTRRSFGRPIYYSLSIPRAAIMSVTSGDSILYDKAAVYDKSWQTQGGFKDTKATLNFYNSQALRGGSRYTAAAFTLAQEFITGTILPTLGRGNYRRNYPLVAGHDHREQPGPNYTVFMPSDLVSRHSAAALNMAHYVLESREVLQNAGYPELDRVWNACGELPQVEYTTELFWETFRLIKHAAQGDSLDGTFEADFLHAIIQNFHLHGNCDEGGIWRKLWVERCVSPNAGVILSKFSRGIHGYNSTPISKILGACITLQSCIARSLVETKLNVHEFMTEPDPNNDTVAGIINMMRGVIVDDIAGATGVAAGYWAHSLKVIQVSDLDNERHISREDYNFFKQYCPIWASYATSIIGQHYGKHDYAKDKQSPLIFTGEYGVQIARHGMFAYAVQNMKEGWKFSDGLFYMSHRFNPSDGLSEMSLYGQMKGSQDPISEEVRLVTGQVITPDDYLGDYMWQENHDFVPSPGELLTCDNGPLLLNPNYLPDWIVKGKYKITIGRWAPLSNRAGRRENQTLTDWHLSKHFMIRSTPTNGRRSRIVNVRRYLQEFKRMNGAETKARTNRLLAHKCRLKMQYDENYDTMDDEGKAASLIRLFGQNPGREDYEIVHKVINSHSPIEKFIQNTKKSEEFVHEMKYEMFNDTINTLSLSVGIEASLSIAHETNVATNALSNKDRWVQLKTKSLATHERFRFVSQQDIDKVRKELAAEGEEMSDTCYMLYGYNSHPAIWSDQEYLSQLARLAVQLKNTWKEGRELLLTSINTYHGTQVRDKYEENLLRREEDITQLFVKNMDLQPTDMKLLRRGENRELRRGIMKHFRHMQKEGPPASLNVPKPEAGKTSAHGYVGSKEEAQAMKLKKSDTKNTWAKKVTASMQARATPPTQQQRPPHPKDEPLYESRDGTPKTETAMIMEDLTEGGLPHPRVLVRPREVNWAESSDDGASSPRNETHNVEAQPQLGQPGDSLPGEKQ